MRVAGCEGMTHAGIRKRQAGRHGIALLLQHLGALAPRQELGIALDTDHQVIHLARRVPEQNRLPNVFHSASYNGRIVLARPGPPKPPRPPTQEHNPCPLLLPPTTTVLARPQRPSRPCPAPPSPKTAAPASITSSTSAMSAASCWKAGRSRPYAPVRCS